MNGIHWYPHGRQVYYFRYFWGATNNKAQPFFIYYVAIFIAQFTNNVV